MGEHADQEQLPFTEPDPVSAATPGESDPANELPFTVQVVRSAKRRRTVGAQLKNGVLVVTIPSWMSRAEEAHWRDEMTARFKRRVATDRIDLRERATTLARRYDLPRPREIKWSDDMTTRWGSCTPGTSTIRLSSRLASFPAWVVDYVIMHELVHLVVHGHDDRFWRLVNQYPKAERAIGYLIAKSRDDEDVD